MSNCPFCNLDSPLPAPNPSEGKRSTGFLRRAWRSIQWVFPAALLVLIPKCPFCVAAYVALFTGIGVSVSTARWIQVLMLVFCLASLGFLVVRFWFRGFFKTWGSKVFGGRIRLFGVPQNRRLRIYRVMK